MLRSINTRTEHRCAICQHWYNPTNSAIRPIRPKNAICEYDDKAIIYCQKMRLDKPYNRCYQDYIGKIKA